MSDLLKPIIAKAVDTPLSASDAQIAFGEIMEGNATPSQIGGFLMVLRTRGESVQEFAAAAVAMRERCKKVTAPKGAMDIVGTGGDGKSTLNISTATAFVVAGTGQVVAKHGNRNLSSRSGTADVQTQMGINVMVGPDVVEKALQQAGIAFMMAPIHHPAMRFVMPARQELGTRTLFNILGPLTNPAGVKYQLTGAYSKDLIRPMAETLQQLGSQSAWLVHGSDGTDELSIAGPSFVAQLKDGAISEFEISPEDAGLPVHPFNDIIGGTPQDNAAAFRALLEGCKNAYRDAVLLNASAALLVSGRVANLRDGVAQAIKSIDSGAALKKLETLAKITSEGAT